MQLEAYSQRIYSKEDSEDDKLKQNSFCNCISLIVFYPFLVSMEIMIFFFFTETKCSNLNLMPIQGSLVDKAARAHCQDRQDLGLNQLQVIT